MLLMACNNGVSNLSLVQKADADADNDMDANADADVVVVALLFFLCKAIAIAMRLVRGLPTHSHREW